MKKLNGAMSYYLEKKDVKFSPKAGKLDKYLNENFLEFHTQEIGQENPQRINKYIAMETMRDFHE